MSDTEDEDRKRKKGKEKEKEPDKSRPDPHDSGLTIWIDRLFLGDERADSLKVLRVFGKREVDPSPVATHLFKLGEKPSKTDIVSASNELWEAMQNDANATRTAMLFEVCAFNSNKGAGAYEVRRVRIEPVKVFVEGWNGGDGEGDDGEIPGFNDHFRKRAVDAWKHAEGYVDKAISTLGGIVHVQAKQLEDRDRMIRDLLNENQQARQQANEAQNNALDRELVREEKKFWLETKRYGRDMLGNFLLPEAMKIGKKMLGDGKDETPSSSGNGKTQMTSEAEAIARTIAGMTPEDRSKVFGDWTDDGVCKKTGILTEDQVRILIGVMNGEDPVHLDKLVSGDYGITDDQGFRIVGSVGMAKIQPIVDIVQKRREKPANAFPPAAPK